MWALLYPFPPTLLWQDSPMGATGYACRFYFYPLNYKIPEETYLWYFGSLSRLEVRLLLCLICHHCHCFIPHPLPLSLLLSDNAQPHSWYALWCDNCCMHTAVWARNEKPPKPHQNHQKPKPPKTPPIVGIARQMSFWHTSKTETELTWCATAKTKDPLSYQSRFSL